jgi:hypothetical protein
MTLIKARRWFKHDPDVAKCDKKIAGQSVVVLSGKESPLILFLLKTPVHFEGLRTYQFQENHALIACW